MRWPKIAAATIPADSPDCPILEIGPGAGFLTRLLLESPNPVTAIEIDSRMVRVLETQFGDRPQLSLIHHDVRKVDLVEHLQPKGVLVGNLPYHLTGPILFQIAGELADADHPVRQHLIKAVLMIQKEVGERLIAEPGHTAYSQLTLQIRYWFTVNKVALIPRQAFYPSPAVDSMVVELLPRPAPAISVNDSVFLSRVIKQSFEHRRKTLLNNLKMAHLGSPERLAAILADLGLTDLQRPQEVSLAQFGALSDALQL